MIVLDCTASTAATPVVRRTVCSWAGVISPESSLTTAV